MPYIRPEDRERLTPPEGMVADFPKTAGELNYLVSVRIKKAISGSRSYALFNDIIAELDAAKGAVGVGARIEGLAGEFADMAFKFVFATTDLETLEIEAGEVEEDERKQRMFSAIGALEAAKLEFYRRVVAPYEDQKMLDNGDVY